MKSITKQLHAIAYLFSTLILFQSCVAYHNTSSSVKEAAQNEKGKIKIKTFDGTEHVVRWFEEKDNAIFSITNTNKAYLPMENISYIKKSGTNPILLSLDSLTVYEGGVVVTAIDDKGIFHDHDFIQIEAQGSVLRGIEILKKDTATILLPRDQIASIKLQNVPASRAGNVLIAVVISLGLILLIGYIDIQQNGLDIKI